MLQLRGLARSLGMRRRTGMKLGQTITIVCTTQIFMLHCPINLKSGTKRITSRLQRDDGLPRPRVWSGRGLAPC